MIRNKIYLNNRDLLSSYNSVLEQKEKSLITQLDNIKLMYPDAYNYITDLRIYNYNQKITKELQINNRNVISNFFAEYQHRKFVNGYFYLDAAELRNTFSNLNITKRVNLISNIRSTFISFITIIYSEKRYTLKLFRINNNFR